MTPSQTTTENNQEESTIKTHNGRLNLATIPEPTNINRFSAAVGYVKTPGGVNDLTEELSQNSDNHHISNCICVCGLTSYTTEEELEVIFSPWTG